MSDLDESLAAANAALHAAKVFPEGMNLAVIKLDEVVEQDVNARTMTPEQFSALARNIEQAGGLESVPLCVSYEGGKRVEIVSGHHRIRAARKAGLEQAVAIVYDELPPDRVKAKQLAHNTLQGEDDRELVKRIFAQIQDVASKIESFVDPKAFANLPENVKFSQPDVDVFRHARYLSIMFLPAGLQAFSDALMKVAARPDVAKVIIATRESYEPWVNAVTKTRQALDVTFVGAALAEMARLVEERLEQLAEEGEEATG